MHFPLFRISPSFQSWKMFPTFPKNFQTFPKKCKFHPPKFLIFFSHYLRICNFPPIFQKRCLPFGKVYYSLPLFSKTSLWFSWIYLVFTYFTYKHSVYFKLSTWCHGTQYSSILSSLPTCAMYYIGCVSLREYSIISPQWSPAVPLVPLWPLLPSVDRCVLLRGVSYGPQDRLAIMLQRTFSVVGLSAWNDLHSLLMAHPFKFYISLKSFFFGRDWAGSASE